MGKPYFTGSSIKHQFNYSLDLSSRRDSSEFIETQYWIGTLSPPPQKYLCHDQLIIDSQFFDVLLGHDCRVTTAVTVCTWSVIILVKVS